MTSDDRVALAVGLVTLAVAVFAWRHARPGAPFKVTSSSQEEFGLERTGYAPVVVEAVYVPHHRRLVRANESASEGPHSTGHGDPFFFDLHGARPHRW
ncbi:hypothetical protein ET495_04155 [Xylanimonas allomyrinae]|uniref:Uncharacterized protein n=1 Tax=Xylanimonas allomyrinae TaxID=2509459 RepID=A0A4P6EJN9_9MICO|nr:hypothetical protein [Xylanimonas allomyrinae]QAY62575.1 hypothetical protein ET495_04155 [Xylanimonas allomyrinae]